MQRFFQPVPNSSKPNTTVKKMDTNKNQKKPEPKKPFWGEECNHGYFLVKGQLMYKTPDGRLQPATGCDLWIDGKIQN
jgi:hypothetical protein